MPPQKIQNWTQITGADSTDQSDLQSLYFEETASGSGEYKLYGAVNGQPNQLVVTAPPTLKGGGGPTATKVFTFSYAGLNWVITSFFVGHAAMGNWSNNHQPEADQGTFVAQAGGTTMDEPVEDASAASAY